MKNKRYYYSMFVCLLSILCLMGLTQSNFPVCKIDVSSYPWPWDEYSTSDYDLWDGGAKVEDMGQENIYAWADILKFANGNKNYMMTLEYNWDAIRKFTELNLFTFTRPGITNMWLPLSWDINLDLDEENCFQRPNALAIKRLLLDKGNEKVKQQVIQNMLQLLKAPETKALWEAQKAELLEWYSYAPDSEDEQEVIAYKAIVEAKYEESLVKAVDYYLSVLNSAVHSDKVFLSIHHNWIITRIVDGVCRFLKDESAFRFYSLCYRLGDDGCKQLKSYLEQAKTELSKS